MFVLGSACATGDEPPTVTRLTIAGVSGVPGAHDPAPVALTSGAHFRRAVALLPRPLPAPHGATVLGVPATESKTCFPIRLNVELSDGRTISYAECGFPRSVLPACASLSALLPRSYRCPESHPRGLVEIDPAARPQSRPAEVVQAVRADLGGGASIELLTALPSAVAACQFVGGCPATHADGRPRPVWFAIAYGDEGVVVPPTYLVVDDARTNVIADRTGPIH